MSESECIQQEKQRYSENGLDEDADRSIPLLGHQNENSQMDATYGDDDEHLENGHSTIVMENGMQVEPDVLEMRLQSQVDRFEDLQ